MTAGHRILVPGSSERVDSSLGALAIMTKAPRAGRVKTRLTPPLTAEEAADLNICFLRDVANSISVATKIAPASGVAVYTPIGAEETYRGILPDEFRLLPQRGESFGERLIGAVQDLLQLGFSSVCLINSDSPTVSPNVFAEAVEALAQSRERVVLGPADDGGYYLIGMTELHEQLFTGIDWSTKRVLQQTLGRAEKIGLEVHLLCDGFDVDDGEALGRLCDEVLPDDRSAARFTRAYLARLMERKRGAGIWPND
jgi:uncharacterized protein